MANELVSSQDPAVLEAAMRTPDPDPVKFAIKAKTMGSEWGRG